ncbi:hypothetical protein ABZP36_013272 [Zizania latifolia]
MGLDEQPLVVFGQEEPEEVIEQLGDKRKRKEVTTPKPKNSLDTGVVRDMAPRTVEPLRPKPVTVEANLTGLVAQAGSQCDEPSIEETMARLTTVEGSGPAEGAGG